MCKTIILNDNGVVVSNETPSEANKTTMENVRRWAKAKQARLFLSRFNSFADKWPVTIHGK